MKDAFDLSPKQLVWMSYRAGKKQAEELRAAAVAGRVSQADKKDWDAFIKSI